MTIWFLGRNYPPEKGGGSQMRSQQVQFLKKNYDVKVITINYKSSSTIENDDVLLTPFIKNKLFRKLFVILDMLGIRDYYAKWIKETLFYLKNNIKEGDVIFATTGGELACLQIAKELKLKYGNKIKTILNYHDLPIDCYYDGNKTRKRFHVNVDKLEKECLECCDYILTNSDNMSNQLLNKYPNLKNISKLYFGYDENNLIFKKDRNNTKKINIVHIGSVGESQSPEVLVKAYEKLSDIQKEKINITFIGDLTNNEYLMKSNVINKISYLPREEMIKYLLKNADYCFISLINNKNFISAMPTKFYEYIGLSIPIIGALPECEAKDVIDNEKFGYTCLYDDLDSLKKILINLYDDFNSEIYLNNLNNLISKREHFDSRNTLSVMNDTIERLLND